MTGSLAAIAIVGIISGWVTGISAAAWGALSVPMLIVLGVEPLHAISSSLAASVIISLFGGLTHWRTDRSRVAPLIPLVLGGVGGALLGSLVSPALPTQVLRLLIGVVAVVAGFSMLLRKNGNGTTDLPDAEDVKWQDRRVTIFFVGAVAGLCAGAIGVGWGTIGVALLIWTGIPPHTVVGSSLLGRSLVALTAASSYTVQAGAFPLQVFLPLLLAGGMGVYLGVHTAGRVSASGMRRFLGGVTAVVGVITVAGTPW
ncbi:MAG: sulfite exporter TauE/SafE family protein [Candidatus Methylomirabilales bacterium]